MFIITAATAASCCSQDVQRLLTLNVQSLDTVHDLLLVSDQRDSKLNDVFECQLCSVVGCQDASTGELLRVAVHLDAGQPVSHGHRCRQSIISIITGQQQLRTLRPNDNNTDQLFVSIRATIRAVLGSTWAHRFTVWQ